VRRVVGIALLAGVLHTGTLAGQAVPEGSQAGRVDLGYRRTPTLRLDPFRYLTIPHWGFVMSFGARGANTALNLSDVGALLKIDSDDEILVGDAIDVLGLIPRGRGLAFSAQGEGGLYLGGPLPGGLAIGFSVQGRGFGAAEFDDDAVALLRDGNGARQEFSLGNSRGSGLVTADYGGHLLLRMGPVYSVDGPRITLGAGARIVRPIAFASGRSLLDNGGRVLVSGDSIVANIQIESMYTPIDVFDPGTAFGDRGSGLAADFLVRFEWPTNGIALEAMVANLGSVTIERVERRTLNLSVATTLLDSVINVLDTASLVIQDTLDLDITLPRVVRFSASAWANAILQVDLAATLPTGGDFPAPLAVDIGTTWRFIRSFPLRAGVILGDNQGVGFSGGFAIESRVLFLQASGQSLGGLFKHATGVGGRFELGFFF